MIEWETTSAGLRVYDGNNSSLSLSGPELDVVSSEGDIPRPVEESLKCAVDELRLSDAVVYVTSLSSGDRYELGLEEPLKLPPDEYLVDVDAEIKTYVRLTGALSVRRTTDYSEVVVVMPERTTVTVGFRARHDEPTDRLTVPPTPAGVATALSYSHAGHRTSGPDRTFPTLRGHPPVVELGDTVDVPDRVRDGVYDTGVELAVPPRVEDLLVVAPLAHYLQARVHTVARERPVLRAPAQNVERELDPMPDLERDATRVLRKTFFLDCLVRNVGPYSTNLAEASLLDTLGLDARRLYEATPTERLSTYLDVPFVAIERRLPDWHLSTYVEPVVEYTPTLPYLLNDLSLVYTPRTSALEGGELVERSLGDFYRSGAGQVASVDVVKPELRSSRIHGWLADGVPIDVFKSTPAAHRNHFGYADADPGPTEAVVVLNDDEMYGEHVDVESVYRERGENLPLTVEVYDHLSTDELARVFEEGGDLVHYIGHCEEDGLRCPNGHMAASTLTECNAQTFFLNACGSYYEGMELVERGAVAGAITFSQVLDEHAARVGSAFARLLVHGFSIERAMQLARRRIMMGKDYAVVGDGTHVLTQSENRLPATAELEQVAPDRFLLTYDQFQADDIGGYYHPYVGSNEYSYLCGNESEFALDRTEVLGFLEHAEMPVIYDGEFRWSHELHRLLSE